MKPVIFRARHEPTHKQFKAGNYAKRKVAWRGMTISIENDAGSVRRGYKPDGSMWETRMLFPYGYLNRTEGVDGDHVDVFLGPHLDAPMVYIVHQKKVGDWETYDEDKCMVGFLSEEDARHAFLSCYDDPRFLGPITAMPAGEFVEKAKATREAPAMIKAIFFKSRVDPYIRGGRVVRGYDNHKAPISEKPLTERQFYNQYAQHIDIRGRKNGNALETRSAILRDGFKRGFGVNALPPSRGGEPMNVVERIYGPKKGDVVYLAPRGAWDDTRNGMMIKDGWVPKPHEAIVIEDDENRSMYQRYLEAFQSRETRISSQS